MDTLQAGAAKLGKERDDIRGIGGTSVATHIGKSHNGRKSKRRSSSSTVHRSKSSGRRKKTRRVVHRTEKGRLKFGSKAYRQKYLGHK